MKSCASFNEVNLKAMQQLDLPKAARNVGKGNQQVATLAAPDNTKTPQKTAQLGVTDTGNALNPPIIGRCKVALKPGRSLIDWMKLGRSGKDLAGTQGKILQVTPEELALHNKEGDAWMALNGKVYNVTPYMEYHPGGIPELMRGVGIDGTRLFNEVHKWVNYESMLAKCFVGTLMPSISTDEKKSLSSLKSLSFGSDQPLPWFCLAQTEKTVSISIHSNFKTIQERNVIVDITENVFHLQLLVNENIYYLDQDLEETVTNFQVNVDRGVGKVNVVLWKETVGRRWTKLGLEESQHTLPKKRFTNEDIRYKKCTVTSVSSVTHDTKLFCIEFPRETFMAVPRGCHVFVSMTVAGVQVSHAYTVVPPSLIKGSADKEVSSARKLHLMIKIYEDGLLTPHLDRLKPGDKLDVSLVYAGDFKESILNDVSHLILYAAGTGFTPMANLLEYFIIHHDTTSIRSLQLVFFNKQERDILWKEELDQLSSEHARFTCHYVLSDPNSQWNGLTGRITRDLMESLSAKPDDTRKVLLCACGPAQFTQAVIRYANDIGYTDNMIHAFVG